MKEGRHKKRKPVFFIIVIVGDIFFEKVLLQYRFAKEILVLQDTVQSVEELDYRVVTKGTKEYDLLIEMESLKKSQKERLLGYIEALKQ